MIKQKRKKKRKLKKVLLGILILALVVLAGAFVVIKVFTVETVKVEGNKLYEDEVIKNSVLNDEYSWNTLYVFFKYKFKKTEEIPFVDSMEISMKIPHEITIQVYEKGMIGYVYIPSIAQNAYFDKDGFVVETSADNIEGVPLISGLSVDTVVLYEKLPIDSNVRKTLLNLTQTLKKYSLTPEEIDYEEDGEMTLHYDDVLVEFGSDEHLNEKVQRLEKILPSLDGMSGTLHMEDWSEETSEIIFRKSS